MKNISSAEISSMRVDGGSTKSDFLMQFQADMIGCSVCRPSVRETTALGAAYLAGLAAGVWGSLEEIRALWAKDAEYTPQMAEDEKEKLTADWHKAVGRSRGWIK